MKHFRKHFLALILVTAFVGTHPLNAQTEDKFKFEPMDIFGGPRVGAALSNLTQLDGSFVVGPSIGGFFEIHFTPRIAVSFDMNYTYEGTNDAKCSFRNSEDATAGGKSDISIHRINTDYRFRYYLTPDLNLATGIHLSRILRAYGKTDGKSIKIHDDLERGGLSIPFAAEYNLGPWAVEASYYLPLRGIARGKEMKNIIGSAKTNLITLTVAYKFQIF